MKFLGMNTIKNHELPMKIPMKSSWTEQKDTSKTHKKQLGQWTGSRQLAVILIIPHRESSYIIGSTLW